MKPEAMSNKTLFALVLMASASTGCDGGDSKRSNAPVGPSGEVDLEIHGFYNNDGESFARDDADRIVLGCDGSLGVELGPRESGGLRNWLLRPPGNCGSLRQCGYVELVVDPGGSGAPDKVASASVAFEVPPTRPGQHTFEVTLYTDDGEEFLQQSEAVSDRLDVTLSASETCDPSTGSGGSGTTGSGGGAGGTGAAAGAGGEAGEGGAGGP
jgi:hypothetical protein